MHVRGLKYKLAGVDYRIIGACV